MLTLDAELHGLVDPWTEEHKPTSGSLPNVLKDSPYPHLVVCRVLPFGNKSYFENVTCLQMTQTRMLFTWHPEILPPAPDERQDNVQVSHENRPEVAPALEGEADGDDTVAHLADGAMGAQHGMPVGDLLGDHDHPELILVLDDDAVGDMEDAEEGHEEGFMMNNNAAEPWDVDDSSGTYRCMVYLSIVVYPQSPAKAVACVIFSPPDDSSIL